MTSILIDTNVLLDIVESRPQWMEWSSRQVANARKDGRVVLNAVVFAEASTPYEDQARFEAAIEKAGLVKEDVPWTAAFIAGKAHLAYRTRGGVKSQTLPDFFIAAHALVKKYTLVTRDAARFRAYFPDLAIIAPDSHP
jgi:predicted nucleic acid-binding protein